MSVLNLLNTKVVVGVGFLYVLAHLIGRRRGRRSLPYPPGPKGYPLIGNVLDMPQSKEWETFTKWRELYGDFVFLNVLGTHLLIINSLECANALLDKKGSIYADRPRFVVGGELIGWDRLLGMSRYGDRVRSQRKMIHPVVGTKSAVETQWSGIIERETRKLLNGLFTQPEDFLQLIRTAVGATILSVAYGYRVEDPQDPLIAIAEQGMTDFMMVTMPGNFLADLIPILKHFTRHTRTVAVLRKHLDDFLNIPFTFVKKQMATGTYDLSFSSQKLAEDSTPADEEDIKWGGLALFGGGADTTVSVLQSFILAMTLYPDVQKKAQAELDCVVGRDRLPNLGDRDVLPYLGALMNEVLRWSPVVPTNLPHVLIEEDEHDGFFVPKGTVVLVNAWGILHDPEIYHDPMEFKPERFLNVDGRAPEMDPHNVGFGFGRRRCPGIEFADASIMVACAMILSTFDISKAVENGVVVEPLVEFVGGISHPMPFRCSIKPRSQHALELITGLN